MTAPVPFQCESRGAGGREAERQQALLAALATGALPPGLRECGLRAERGLAAYRANAEAIAERALGAAFPTLRAMLGGQEFARLTREFWSVHPPVCGDLGEWGGALPDWLAAHAGLVAWPWLADSARLDLALHRCERAASGSFDQASLWQLQSADPALLRLEFSPGCALLEAAWPIAALWEAHRAGDGGGEAALSVARQAILDRRAEAVMVAREGWRAVAHRLDVPTAAFLREVMAGRDLAAALNHAGAGFDFAAWLAAGLRQAWLVGVRVVRT